ELILLTDRPPQLETPLYYFSKDLTPNEAFFVRWHMAGIPTRVDLSTFKLEVSGHVDKTLWLSVDELKKQFDPVSIVAVVQCSGNSRSFFEPKVPGGQWQHGAVGNAKWTGVRLKDILAKAGVKPGALEVSFAGLDEPPLVGIHKFEKALTVEHALDENVIVAYEMNDQPLPMLNGFPLRLVVPGWYATYWVKALSTINVLDSKFDGFWMAKAYRIPKNKYAEESPKDLAKDTEPINRMNVRSLFVKPDPSEVLKAGSSFTIEGLAFDGGEGISKVMISLNNGAWEEAKIVSEDLGKFSWCRWGHNWTPAQAGTYNFRVKAVNTKGETQDDNLHWNKSGYMFNGIDSIQVKVV
ncbi:MAG: molybdopterin-dependent oxidoreductase, partial [Candidatus Obscuribacterales bacterium]|nr:molybdopterin-dependent oxidoreductase [Candidatus Obscuribacterales bacterium]